MHEHHAVRLVDVDHKRVRRQRACDCDESTPAGIYVARTPGRELDPAHAAGRSAHEGGADDKVFRLERVNNSECAELMPDRKEVASLQRK